MRSLNFFKLLSVLSIMLVGLSSCEDDETFYHKIIDHTWVGDLGFSVGVYPVESLITFKGNEYAIDEQYYYEENGGRRAATLDVRWWIDGGSLYLDYGREYPMLELREIHVDSRYLRGNLYANGMNEGSVVLEIVN